MRPEVWAPQADLVELVTTTGRYPMRRSSRPGWWQAEQYLVADQRYGFALDGGAALPDPRTLSQPDGVHGLSRYVAPQTFTQPSSWAGTTLRGKVGYEVHVGTFTPEGTLDSAIGALDYLSSLGIGFVELMPLGAFPGRWGWGYDQVAPWSVHEGYGGPEALVRFVAAAHERGLGVVLDMVYNHLGPEGNYLAQFGPYFTSRHTTPWGEAVNLDGPNAHEVRDYLLGSARHFLLTVGVDGLRLDAVHALYDDSPYHFLAELADKARKWEQQRGRPIWLVAESDLNQPEMVSPTGSSPGARGMDAQWADDVHHALHSFFSGEQQGYYVDFGSAETLVKALTRIFIHDGSYSTFRKRLWGAPLDTSSGYYDGASFVVFLQNHDQVGNRALGDRFAQHAGFAAQAAAAALYLLGPGTPMLFMGEEWATSSPFPFFSDLGEPLGDLVTAGRAREFAAMGWTQPTPDPGAKATFLSATLRWEEQKHAEHAKMLSWYQQLIQLRQTHPELRDPDLSKVHARVVDPDTVRLLRGPFAITASRSGQVNISRDERVVATWG